MIDLILHMLILGFVILLIAETVPGIYIDGYGTALVVAIVYGLVNVTLGTVLKLIALPLVIVTVGLFLLVINWLMLALTDALIDDFEIEDMGTTFIAALLITLADAGLDWVF